MANVSGSTSSSKADAPTAGGNSAACPRGPASASDLREQGSAFRNLLGATDIPAAGEEDGEGMALPGTDSPAEQMLAWAGLAQRQGGQQGSLQSQTGIGDAAADALHAELSPITQGMSATSFALWRRLQGQHPGAAGEAGVAPQAVTSSSVDPAGSPAHVAADPEGSFAALVEKQVRQMLVTLPVAGQRGGEVRISLSDAVLPDTSLNLKRTGSGWKLLARSGNQASIQALQEYAPALVARFTKQSLGMLEVEIGPA